MTATEIETMRDKIVYGAKDMAEAIYAISAENKRVKALASDLADENHKLLCELKRIRGEVPFSGDE